MARGILRLVAAALLGVVAAGSMVITGYLAMLEKGMDQNLQAVQREVAAQKSIQAQNAALDHMVAVTDSIGTRVAAMATTTEALLANVSATAEANRAVLTLNTTLAGNNGAAAGQLRQVAASLDDMNQSTRAVGRSLDALTETMSTQKESLVSILWYVTGMKTRTPELKL
jgi:uncharacterized protein YoxC